MSAMLREPQHPLIWLGHCPAQSRLLLAAEGWHVRDHPLVQWLDVGIRRHDHVVVLIDLTGQPLEWLEHALAIAQAFAHLACLCLLPARAPAAAWSGITRHCAHVLHAPLQNHQLASVLHSLPHGLPDTACALEELVGESPAMRAVRSTARKFAPVELPVLITGQTGTGKEMAARTLHALSPRSHRPLQAELFGHERGAFTGATQRRAGLFEHADGSTVFLDEVGDLPADAQTALLRVLQEGTLERIGSHDPVQVDVRVITATHVDLEQAVEEGRFRCDLYYRINVLRLQMPTLQQRPTDIPLLACRALSAFRLEHGVRARGFSPDALEAMAAYPWPGNVRALINRVQRAATLCDNDLIEPEDLELARRDPCGCKGNGLLDDARRQAEHEALIDCLRRNAFNISAVAREMQISRVTVYRLCRRVGLDPAEQR